MRVPLKGGDYFCQQVNAAAENVAAAHLEAVKPVIAMQKTSAMLGDGTVTQVDTFDPRNVHVVYQRLAGALEKEGWLITEISKSTTEDLHRLYCQFVKEIGKHHVSAYFGIQFHALPYYRVDRRVFEIQKELARIAGGAGEIFNAMACKADKALQAELEKRGYADLDPQELFTKMFDDEKLVEALDEKASSVEGQFPEFEEMRKKKSRLFAELNELLIELYQTSPVQIDYNRLMQGEEGVTTYIDIEVIKNKKTKKREAFLDTEKIAKESADMIASELRDIVKALRKVAKTYVS